MINQDKIRAFIAIEFPDEIIKEVARAQELINNKIKFTGKLTELENLHLTLKFLGEIDENKLKEIKQKLSEIKFSEFQAKLLNIGTFSYKSNPKIVWIKLGGKEIFELQKQIDLALESLFPKESRFMSHLTIARIKNVKDKTAFDNYIRHIRIKSIKFPVNSFFLKSSELKPLGPIYATLEKYELI